MKSLAALVAVPLVFTACATTGNDDGAFESESSSTRYVNMVDFAKIDALDWIEATASLAHQFDDICGDTFCEGEYSNLQPLTLACSVSSKAGNIKDCAWTFAASQLEVDSRTANFVINAPTFECHLQMKTTAQKLLATLNGSSASLYEPLPGAPSIYDQLGDCFEHPVMQTTGEFTTVGTERYISSRDYYSGAGVARWYTARMAVKAGFDRVCGDTVCGGDFGDYQSLDLQCAITKSTGNVKGCEWVFGGSYFLVAEKTGKLNTEHKTFNCGFDVNGTLSQLITTWTAAGSESAINRPLPGSSATAYDALVECL